MEQERTGEAESGQAVLAALQEEVAALRERLVAAHRRALLAEHRGEVIEELVQGDSVEALDASVARAREAYARVAARLRAGRALAPVPASNGARTGPRVEGLSPQAKIAAALRERERY
ncbi:MAG TPA: hypothetical protein VKZ60_19970 [Chloroflexota bacterium]|nr:hypothetical protein [Chloroflexota bacterium]